MKPCQTCKAGDCENCLNSPENSTPVKLYTPKDAILAMLDGKVLKSLNGMDCIYNDDCNSFQAISPKTKNRYGIVSFENLYEEYEG